MIQTELLGLDKGKREKKLETREESLAEMDIHLQKYNQNKDKLGGYGESDKLEIVVFSPLFSKSSKDISTVIF